MVFRVPNGTEIAPADRAKAAKLGYVGDYIIHPDMSNP